MSNNPTTYDPNIFFKDFFNIFIPENIKLLNTNLLNKYPIYRFIRNNKSNYDVLTMNVYNIFSSNNSAEIDFCVKNEKHDTPVFYSITYVITNNKFGASFYKKFIRFVYMIKRHSSMVTFEDVIINFEQFKLEIL
jgi:hypothetical protein